ncbi:protein Lines homolog 1 isoform X2 [Triplophysa dalaica]|uniref:protein Lines homolog 1 isoform X2 n=1 Tax=Triplophysa dalaica TaxID=1582913 RepID=UPI0024DFCEF7|nr:protein Lines homolog 1 isoform X2 [Triplophysa dalaica]
MQISHIMNASGLDFQTLFSLLNAGASPSVSSEDLASRISSHLSPQTAGSVTDTEAICLCLTLSERITARLSSQSLPQDVSVYYEAVMGSLCEINLMEKLISFLDCQDQLVSHLSAKCMSTYVISDVCMTGSICSLWRHKCADVFHRSDPGNELDSCLWSVTAVIKGLLRGKKNDVLMKLVAALDASLSCLYTRVLSQASMKPHEAEMTKLNRTMCAFFDLLEVLSAVRMRCGICSSVQRTVFVESRALLDVVRCDAEYFVKKRALLLLKRTLVRRAGEDWALGDVQCVSRENEGLNEDLGVMADVVLQEVKAGWLQDVPVKDQPSFFGGNCDVGDSGMRKDGVMLRALSLILLKSLEINIQSPENIDVQLYLSELMSFLRRHGSLMSPDTHSCTWVTSVFAEQDDDVIESSKALILLYLHHKRLSSSVPVCPWGCNPHCHFISFLCSISFDHTVLLDFLISTETCFLEYCVRYLKLLRDDWTGFCISCQVEDGNASSSDTSETAQTDVSAFSRPSTGSDVTASPVLRLVDYGSSEESEEEESGFDHHTNRNVRNSQGDFGRTEVESTDVSECLFYKVLVCLEELKMAITRLHNRGLFPYNPASLLKLLNNVEVKKSLVG